MAIFNIHLPLRSNQEKIKKRLLRNKFQRLIPVKRKNLLSRVIIFLSKLDFK